MRSRGLVLSCLRLTATSAVGAAASSFSRGPHPNSRLRLRQVLVVHRHGDRSPITPMKDEEYWRRTLPEEHVLDGIARGTTLLRPPEGPPRGHGAVGRGPFGQLTMRGLLQMVSLGERLREELGHVHDDDDDDDGKTEEAHHPFVNRGRLFTRRRPLHPSRISVSSTDFPRTIQSVQGLLAGLFPDDVDDPIEIDLRHTNSYFIPDPQPRQCDRQLSLERHLSNRPHLAEREGRLRELAERVTDALEGHLGEGAGGVSFGVGEEKDDGGGGGGGATRTTAAAAAATTTENRGESQEERRRRPLAWAQLAEILVCLHSREMLPPTLSKEDVDAVSSHVAWRWFENLRHPVLAKAAMWKFADRLVGTMQRKASERHDLWDHGDNDLEMEVREYEEEECAEEPWLCIYSAHDSTLIGLLCVLQLEQPSLWPEYGSALKVELIREEIMQEGDGGGASSPTQMTAVRHWVRFSLNGQVLRSTWLTNGDTGEPMSMVPLNELADMIHSEHELFEDGDGDESGLRYSWKDGLLKEH